MAEEREPSLENVVWRLEQRQQDMRATIVEHRERLERMEKRLHEIDMKIQWLNWHAQDEQVVSKELLPLAQKVAAVSSLDPALVRIVIGSLLAAVIGLSVGNLAFFGGAP